MALFLYAKNNKKMEVLKLAGNSPVRNHTFYDKAATIAETSTCIMPVTSNASTMTLRFNCTGTFSAKIYASIFDKDKFYSYPCLMFPDYTTSDSVTDGAKLYSVDLSCIDYIKIVLTSLTGTITVDGKVCG